MSDRIPWLFRRLLGPKLIPLLEQLADVPSRLTAIQSDNRAHDAEILSRIAALRQRVVTLEDTVEKAHFRLDSVARVLTEDLEQTKAGVSTIQGNAVETLSHVIGVGQHLANLDEEIRGTKNGVSAVQGGVGEILSHVLVVHRHVAGASDDRDRIGHERSIRFQQLSAPVQQDRQAARIG